MTQELIVNQKKKLLLIQAISMEGPGVEQVYPIGLVSIATLLNRTGAYDLTLLDLNLSPDPYGELDRVLSEGEYDAIGLSFRNVDPLGNRTTSLVVPLKITLGMIDQRVPKDMPIFIGGTGFTLFPERLLGELPRVTAGFCGEAEDTFTDFVAAVLKGNQEDLKEVPGACFVTDEGVHLSRGLPFNMRDYRVIDRDLLNPKPYLEANHYVESLGIESKRGCAFDCAYCAYPTIQGHRMRLRDPKSVVDEIELIRDRYGAERFHFTDPIVNCPPNHLDAICEEMVRRGVDLKWSGFFREDTLTEERAALYRDAGCECFSLSPDGLGDRQLKMLDKHLTSEDILKCARILSKTGVTSVYHFLVNTPGWDEGTTREAKELIENLYEIHDSSVGTIVLNLVRIMPGTKIEHQALADGTIDESTDLLYPTYYDPPAYRTLRYELEVFHQSRNIENWLSQSKALEAQAEDNETQSENETDGKGELS